MASLKKDDIKQEVFDLYDKYAHNQIDRREFMEKLSVYAVGGITIASLMSFKRAALAVCNKRFGNRLFRPRFSAAPRL